MWTLLEHAEVTGDPGDAGLFRAAMQVAGLVESDPAALLAASAHLLAVAR